MYKTFDSNRLAPLGGVSRRLVFFTFESIF